MVQTNRPDKHQDAHNPVKDEQVPNRRDTIIACIVLLAVAAVGLSLLIYFGQKITANNAALYSFVAQNLLSLLVFLAVAAQALIYFSQRNLMHKQWREMEKQARSADESVVFGLRAYVGIHSLDPVDAETKQISLRIENSGKVPAYNIDVKILMEVRIPEHSIPDEQARNPPWKIGSGFTHMNWGYSHYYGRAKLFPRGNLPIAIPVALNSWLSRKQIALIANGPAEMRFKGNIEFNDGFHKGKNTPFAFRYSRESHQWIVDAVITKEEVEARLREQMGGRDISQDWHIIEAYVPRVVISKAEKKPD